MARIAEALTASLMAERVRIFLNNSFGRLSPLISALLRYNPLIL